MWQWNEYWPFVQAEVVMPLVYGSVIALLLLCRGGVKKNGSTKCAAGV
jgi:hypothetical protein